MRDDDFSVIHAAINAAFTATLPQQFTVSDYVPEQATGTALITTPALLIEAVSIKPGQKRSGGRLAISVEFAAHCILSMKTHNVELEVKNVAARVLQVVDKNRWGLAHAEQPSELSAYAGMFSEKLGFDSWVVSWQQEFHLGDVVLGDDWLPEQVFIGEAPNIGADHKDDYQELTHG